MSLTGLIKKSRRGAAQCKKDPTSMVFGGGSRTARMADELRRRRQATQAPEARATTASDAVAAILERGDEGAIRRAAEVMATEIDGHPLFAAFYEIHLSCALTEDEDVALADMLSRLRKAASE